MTSFDNADLIAATDLDRDRDARPDPGRLPARPRRPRSSAHYIPFDYVNPRARVVLVGISPGFVQWKNAVRKPRSRACAPACPAELLRAAKYTGAFSGAIRPNLVALLDHVGLQRWLGIASCATLFGADAHLMHVTGVLRQPVFVDGKNYNGAAPNMLTTPLLQAQMLDYFAPEAAQLPDAVFVPLGPKVGLALALAGAARRARRGRASCMACPTRPARTRNASPTSSAARRRPRLSSRTNGDQIDADRLALREKMAALGMAPTRS